jgi:hypothetical protein
MMPRQKLLRYGKNTGRYGMKDIVGARIGDIVTNDRSVIAAAIDLGTITEWIIRPQRRLRVDTTEIAPCLMVLAKEATLFCLDDEGNVYPPGIPGVQVKMSKDGRIIRRFRRW